MGAWWLCGCQPSASSYWSSTPLQQQQQRRQQHLGADLRCAHAAALIPQGIVNRLAVDEAEVEERVFVEAITNQYESREAVKYAGGCLCCSACWACWACVRWVWAGMCLRLEQQPPPPQQQQQQQLDCWVPACGASSLDGSSPAASCVQHRPPVFQTACLPALPAMTHSRLPDWLPLPACLPACRHPGGHPPGHWLCPEPHGGAAAVGLCRDD